MPQVDKEINVYNGKTVLTREIMQSQQIAICNTPKISETSIIQTTPLSDTLRFVSCMLDYPNVLLSPMQLYSNNVYYSHFKETLSFD